MILDSVISLIVIASRVAAWRSRSHIFRPLRETLDCHASLAMTQGEVIQYKFIADNLIPFRAHGGIGFLRQIFCA